VLQCFLSSVLLRCWLGGRKGIRPVKTEWWGAGVVICLEQGANLPSWYHCHSLSLSSVKSRLVLLTFLVQAHLASPRQRAVKRMYVQWFQQFSRFITKLDTAACIIKRILLNDSEQVAIVPVSKSRTAAASLRIRLKTSNTREAVQALVLPFPQKMPLPVRVLYPFTRILRYYTGPRGSTYQTLRSVWPLLQGSYCDQQTRTDHATYAPKGHILWCALW